MSKMGRYELRKVNEAIYESPCGNVVDGLPHVCHSVGSELLQKIASLKEFSEFLKNLEKMSIESAPALRVIRAGTRLRVYRALPYQNHRQVG